MGAYNNLDTAVLGLMVGIEALRDFQETLRNGEGASIAYGAPLFQAPGDPVNAHIAHTDNVLLTQSGTFGASNSFVMTLNGVALSAIVYSTNNADMYTAIKAALVAALPATAVVTVVAGSYTINVYNPGYDITLTGATTGGSAVTSTPTYSNGSIFMGVAGFTQLSFRDSTGGYPADYQMNSAYFGQIWVYASKAVSSGSKAYVIYAPGATQGQFTDSASATYDIHALFRTSTTGPGLVIVELKGKQNPATSI